ncbi:MAG: 3-oxoacyl-[acyl-carrier-protein] reductase FabG [Candidatus Ordinivivax streblomastigis]|uniref:3-oxoacyl-[acyl-carrier-protein] reductase FabG n=1 Tax=Candidatus Ordinivivax streblomastigis TaxID=2540710 RepID=A0A5M8P236_9BACT|nr:MAG: 3-oxoacyl-[acyl-carrier-protein] reductase FabG [Candidatus Ordinivivax streblomastigis]
MNNPYQLNNKRILITGASSGIGKATALLCSQLGAELIITGRDENRLTATFDALSGAHHKKAVADLTQEEEVCELIASLQNIDGFVHCAGINKRIPVQSLSQQYINNLLQTNFTSGALLSKYLVSKRKLNTTASVVFISSISVHYPAIGNAMYCASKGALNSFSKGLALELATKKIRVNCIEPGMIASEWLSKSALSDEQLEQAKLKYPLKRFGTPEEVAYLAAFLLSDMTAWMTGSSIVMDGGLTLQ